MPPKKKKPKLPMPKYVPADKDAFLEKMRSRMHGHQSLRVAQNTDIAVVVLTAWELEMLINLASHSS